MNFRLVFKLTGKTLLVEAGALLLPLLVCLFYRENPLPFLLSIAMTGAVGLALSLIRSNDHFFPREGFFAVALIWLLMSAFGALISPKLLTAGQILQVVRGMQNSKGSVMNALYKIADGHAEAMEFVANATTRNRDTPLRELRLKPGILVAVLVHQGRIVIPDGSSSIAAGDTVIVISRNHGILDLNDIFEDSLLELGGDA